jgi:hypothetical protein
VAKARLRRLFHETLDLVALIDDHEPLVLLDYGLANATCAARSPNKGVERVMVERRPGPAGVDEILDDADRPSGVAGGESDTGRNQRNRHRTPRPSRSPAHLLAVGGVLAAAG